MAINKPHDYDEAKAWGESQALEPGGYICKVMNARETISKAGNQMVEMLIDIDEGPEAGRFMNLYNNSDPKKWSNGAIVRQLILKPTDKTTHGGFKNMIQVIEESNNSPVVWGDGFIDWIKNKRIGLLFYREQFVGRDGNLAWSTKVDGNHYKTIEQIKTGDFKTPEDVPYVENGVAGGVPNGFQAIEDNDIPF